MADRRRPSRGWEWFTCDHCAETARRPRTPDPNLAPPRCWCCSFLDTVQDVELREDVRTILAPVAGSAADRTADWRFGDQADAPEKTGRRLH